MILLALVSKNYQVGLKYAMLLKPFTYFLILGISTVIVAPLITKASSLEDRVALEDQGVRIIANTVDRTGTEGTRLGDRITTALEDAATPAIEAPR